MTQRTTDRPRESWPKRLSRRLWGYDFFISYHWGSGVTYATALAQELTNQGYDCFLDRQEFAAGDDWALDGDVALRRTKTLLVVGTREALLHSKPVALEIANFLRGSRRIVPITFGASVDAPEQASTDSLRLLSDTTIRIVEEPARLSIGPSPDTLAKIVSGQDTVRRRTVRARIVAVTVSVLLAMLTTVVILWIGSEKARSELAAALRRTRATALAREAKERSRTDPLLGLLLARASLSVERTAPGAQALRDTLLASRARRMAQGHSAAAVGVHMAPSGERFLTYAEDGSVVVWSREGAVVHRAKRDTEVCGAVLDTTGQRVAMLDETGTLAIERVGQASHPVVRHAHARQGGGLACDAKSELIVSWGVDNKARIWDWDGNAQGDALPLEDELGEARFSPDGKFLVCGGLNGTTRLWTRKGELKATVNGGSSAMCVAPGSDAFLTGLLGDRVYDATLWSLDGTPLGDLRGHDNVILDACFSPDGSFIYTASVDGTVRKWDRACRPVATFRGHTTIVSIVRTLGNGDRLVSVDQDGGGRLWTSDGTLLAVLQPPPGAAIRAVLPSEGGRELITSHQDGTVWQWEVEGREGVLLRGHEKDIEDVQVSPDGARILTASSDGTARLWDLRGTAAATLPHADAIWSAVFSKQGDAILTSSMDRTARLWHASGTLARELRGHTWIVRNGVFAPDGQTIATAGDHTARVWSREGESRAVLSGHSHKVWRVVFDPSGQRLATPSVDGTCGLWRPTGERLALLDPPGSFAVRDAAFLADDVVVTASDDGKLRRWSTAGDLLNTVEGSADSPLRVVVALPNGKEFVSGSENGELRLWSHDAKRMVPLIGHIGAINHVAVGSDGALFASASDDGTARVWTRDGALHAVLRGHVDGATVQAVAFSPDGRLVVTGGADRVGRVWYVGVDDLLALAAVRSVRQLSQIERAEFRELLGADATVR